MIFFSYLCSRISCAHTYTYIRTYERRNADTNMANESIIKLFEGNQVRILWNEAEEKYYFSVVDIVGVLTDSVNPADYIKKMKSRDKELAKGWGQIVTPPLVSNAWWQAENQFRRPIRHLPHYPVHTFQEGRTDQELVGRIGPDVYRADD